MSRLNISQKVGTYMETQGKDVKRTQSRDIKATMQDVYLDQKEDLNDEQRDSINFWVDKYQVFRPAFVYNLYKKNDWNQTIVKGLLQQILENNQNNKSGQWATAGKKPKNQGQADSSMRGNFRKQLKYRQQSDQGKRSDNRSESENEQKPTTYQKNFRQNNHNRLQNHYQIEYEAKKPKESPEENREPRKYSGKFNNSEAYEKQYIPKNQPQPKIEVAYQQKKNHTSSQIFVPKKVEVAQYYVQKQKPANEELKAQTPAHQHSSKTSTIEDTKTANDVGRKFSNASSDGSDPHLGGSEPYEGGQPQIEQPVQPRSRNDQNFPQSGAIGSNSSASKVQSNSVQRSETDITISRAPQRDQSQHTKQAPEPPTAVPAQPSQAATVVAQATSQKPIEPPPIFQKSESNSAPQAPNTVNPVENVNANNLQTSPSPSATPLSNVYLCFSLQDNNTGNIVNLREIPLTSLADLSHLSALGISFPGNYLQKDYNHFN